MEDGKLDELLKNSLKGFSGVLLFAVDKLMSELVVDGGGGSSGGGGVITFAPLNAYHRRLIHIMVRAHLALTPSPLDFLIKAGLNTRPGGEVRPQVGVAPGHQDRN
jgi:hypothetical protein